MYFMSLKMVIAVMCEVERYEENISGFLGFMPSSAIYIYLCSDLKKNTPATSFSCPTEVHFRVHSCANRANTFHVVKTRLESNKSQSSAVFLIFSAAAKYFFLQYKSTFFTLSSALRFLKLLFD